MLNEHIEYSDYTDSMFDANRLKYQVLDNKTGQDKDSKKATSLGGLGRALSIIARRFCYLESSLEATPLCAVEALKSWNGFSNPCEECLEKENCIKYSEILKLQYWFPKYVLLNMKKQITEKHSKVPFGNYIELINTIDMLISSINDYMNLDLYEYYDLFNNINAVGRWFSILTKHQYNCKFHYNIPHINEKIVYDSSTVKYNEHCFDAIVSTAIDLGPLQNRVLMVQSSAEIHDKITKLSDKKLDKVEKLISAFLIFRLSESSFSSPARFDVINWYKSGSDFLDKTTKQYFEDVGNNIIQAHDSVIKSNCFLIDIDELDKYLNQGYIAYFDRGQKDNFIIKNV